MNDIISTSVTPVNLPAPRSPISIRPGTIEDISFIDGLQKIHTKMVGWMPTKALEGKIKLGHVIIAEDGSKTPVGYCIGNDQYFKRDDVGIIYQLNVVPGHQRGLIGATLIKAMFDRAAYGCKLFCCWCAQDIEANRFWESLGFVPLAFRAGSEGKRRVHIFWQRRIREGDVTTPYWFPAQTNSGSIREDRLVLPIPPGTHWSDAKPIVLPGGNPQLEDSGSKPVRKSRIQKELKPQTPTTRRVQFGPPSAKPAEQEKKDMGETPMLRKKRAKQKNDPRLIAAARELRDRYLESVESGKYLPQACGKYEVSKQFDATIEPIKSMPLLAA